MPAEAGIQVLNDLRIEVVPVRIPFFNQFDLPVAAPFLQVLLTSDGRHHIVAYLEVDQCMNLILLRETIYRVGFVLPDALCEITRHASIKSAIPFAGKYVHARKLTLSHALQERLDSRLRE